MLDIDQVLNTLVSISSTNVTPEARSQIAYRESWYDRKFVCSDESLVERMLKMNDFLDFHLNKQHHEELIRRTAQHALIRKPSLRHPGSLIAAIRVHRPALSQLGRMLIAMGTSLQIRYGETVPTKSGR